MKVHDYVSRHEICAKGGRFVRCPFSKQSVGNTHPQVVRQLKCCIHKIGMINRIGIMQLSDSSSMIFGLFFILKGLGTN